MNFIMQSINKFVYERLHLNKQTKPQEQDPYENTMYKIATLLGFYKHDFDPPIEKCIGPIKYIKSWIISNEVEDVIVYITQGNWDHHISEWDSDEEPLPEKREYSIVKDAYVFHRMLRNAGGNLDYDGAERSDDSNSLVLTTTSKLVYWEDADILDTAFLIEIK